MNKRVVKRRAGEYQYREGEKKLYWIWWVIGPLIQVIVTLPLVFKRIHLRAILITSAFFIAAMFSLENLAIYWGWWIWNEQKLWGPKVLLVPLEEFLLYLIAVPAVITIQILLFKLWAKILGR